MIENHKDETATAGRNFKHPESYVSISGHDYLAGIDKTIRRAEIYRAAGGEVVLHFSADGKRIDFAENRRDAVCQGCEKKHRVNWWWSDWHHLKGGMGPERCDCLHNSRFVCKNYHGLQHGRVLWSRTISLK